MTLTSSVVVHDLDVLGATRRPHEADPPLVIDPDAVLASSIPCERFQAVPRGNSKIVEGHCGIEDRQLPQRRTTDAGVNRPDTFTLPQPLGVTIPE
jgi:hypothetical protein